MRRVLIPLDLPPAVPVAPPRDEVVHTLHGETMGTTWSVKFVAPSGYWPAPLLAAVERVLAGVIAQMSTWVVDSDISRFNAAPAETWLELPADLYEVLRYALTVSEETGGAFDASIGEFVDLWGFGPPGRRGDCPDATSIAAARQGRGRFRLASGRRAYQPGDIRLDLSGIAKGFAVDRVSAELSRFGVAAHLVEIGGELCGAGVKPDNSPGGWRSTNRVRRPTRASWWHCTDWRLRPPATPSAISRAAAAATPTRSIPAPVIQSRPHRGRDSAASNVHVRRRSRHRVDGARTRCGL